MEVEAAYTQKAGLAFKDLCQAGGIAQLVESMLLTQAGRLGHHTNTIPAEAICFVKAESHHLVHAAFKLTVLLPQPEC